MSARFNGKVAIVTGGSAGIGAAIVERLVAEGARVMVAGRNPHPSSSDAIAFHRTDVSNSAEVSAMVAATVAKFGRVDLLVNNVGVGAMGEAPDLAEDVWHNLFALNLSSMFYACKFAIPEMRKAGGGAILNIASIGGLVADYGMGAYNASKGAVINYTRSIALDCARDTIRVNVLCPGAIGDTQVKVGSHGSQQDQQEWIDPIPLKRLGTSAEIANVAAFLLSDEASYVTGAVIVADGGVTAHTGLPNIPAKYRKPA